MQPIVIIPTYNEAENVCHIIDAVMKLSSQFDLLVIDDNSPDGTADMVRSKQIEYQNRIHLIERSGKLGLGTAYIEGFKYGLKKGYKYLFEMDADFSHPPEKLEELYEACRNGSDVAVGSRYVNGGGVKDWSWERVVLSKGASIYVQLLTSMPIKDPTAGFVCYTDHVLRAINLDKIKFIGYAFQIEMKYVFWRLGFKISEVPITFKDRELGVSKMNFSIFKEAIVGVIKLRLRNIHMFYGK